MPAVCDAVVVVVVVADDEEEDDADDEDDAEEEDDDEDGADEEALEEEGAGLDVRLGESKLMPPMPIGWFLASAAFCGVTKVVAPRTTSPPALAAPTSRPTRPPTTDRLLRRALTVAQPITKG